MNRKRLRVWWFLLRKVPLVLFCGVRLLHWGPLGCTVTMKRTWRNRNPYNASYFASIMAAGETAAGIPLFDRIMREKAYGIKLAVVIRSVQCKFVRPLNDVGTFTCDTSILMHREVDNAIRDNHSVYTSITKAYNPQGKLIAQISITWIISRIL